jgi:hypothetical protein
MREVAIIAKPKNGVLLIIEFTGLWMLSSEVRLSRFAMGNALEARPTL